MTWHVRLMPLPWKQAEMQAARLRDEYLQELSPDWRLPETQEHVCAAAHCPKYDRDEEC